MNTRETKIYCSSLKLSLSSCSSKSNHYYGIQQVICLKQCVLHLCKVISIFIAAAYKSL